MSDQSMDTAAPLIPALSGWESERDTERAKVNVRWFAIALLLAVLLWMRRHDPVIRAQVSPTLAWGLAVLALLGTALEALYLWKPNRTEIPRWFKYVTVFGDMAFISVL